MLKITQTNNWKEELQSEIMEHYIFLAEMKQKAKDKTAHMIEMREQWYRLCNFIQNLLDQQKKDLLTELLNEAPEDKIVEETVFINYDNRKTNMLDIKNMLKLLNNQWRTLLESKLNKLNK